MKTAFISFALAVLSVPAFAKNYTCDAVMAGTGLGGTVLGTVHYGQSPFSFVFEAADGARSNLFGDTGFCGASVKSGQCHGPSAGSVTGERAVIDCDDSGKEYRASSAWAPGSNVTDGDFWFDTDHGKFECWSSMKSPMDRPLKTLVHFENCR